MDCGVAGLSLKSLSADSTVQHSTKELVLHDEDLLARSLETSSLIDFSHTYITMHINYSIGPFRSRKVEGSNALYGVPTQIA